MLKLSQKNDRLFSPWNHKVLDFWRSARPSPKIPDFLGQFGFRLRNIYFQRRGMDEDLPLLCQANFFECFDVHLELRFYKWAMSCRSGRSA